MYTTTDDAWEYCGSTFLVKAKNEEKAKEMVSKVTSERIYGIDNVATFRGVTEIQMSIVE